ncbi:hypothetical protein [Suipraeoptans intestinalis]|nr:hypothetical protein [Suipraeoptans intestinalis]MDY3122440.1 hypothetical protein [Suipraeoptans intestinalis]
MVHGIGWRERRETDWKMMHRIQGMADCLIENKRKKSVKKRDPICMEIQV